MPERISHYKSEHYEIGEYPQLIVISSRSRGDSVMAFRNWDQFAEFRNLMLQALPLPLPETPKAQLDAPENAWMQLEGECNGRE